jgi:hypothetical protein
MSYAIDKSRGNTKGTQWISAQRRYNVPKIIKYSSTKVAQLAYISEDQIKLAISSTTIRNPEIQLTPWNVYFYGEKTTFFTTEESVVYQTPLYWQPDENLPVGRLVYLTAEQFNVLLKSDLHGIGFENQTPTLGINDIFSFVGGNSNKITMLNGDFKDFAYRNPVFGIDFDKWEIASNITSSQTSVYHGTLTSLGTLVAESLSVSDPLVEIVESGGGYKTGEILPLTVFNSLTSDKVTCRIVPYSTGYFRQYWRNPTLINFGANSAVPAITGVIPEDLTDVDGNPILDMQGSLLYYIDLQIQRLSGNDAWSNKKFIPRFRDVVSWTLTSNGSTVAADNLNKPLENFGSNTITKHSTQNFDIFLVGKAFKQSMQNIGKYASFLPKGEFRNGKWVGFGTPNSLIVCLRDNGLVDLIVNNGSTISDEVEFLGINFTDIYNPDYSTGLRFILENVTNKDDLITAQEVLGSSINDIKSLADFLSIEKVSGLNNDSEFKSFEEIGSEVGVNYPTLVIDTGQDMVDLLNKLELPENTDSVEKIKGKNSAVKSELTDSVTDKLATTQDKKPVTVSNVAGMATGYLNEDLKNLNLAIAEIYANQTYGTQIRDILIDISRFGGNIALTDQEKIDAANSSTYFLRKTEEKKTEYLNILTTISNDSILGPVVSNVNQLYTKICRAIYQEYRNFNLARFEVEESPPVDTTSTITFIKDLNRLGEDSEEIGTDLFLYSLAQDNEAGHRFKTALNYGKNDAALRNAGVRRKNKP